MSKKTKIIIGVVVAVVVAVIIYFIFRNTGNQYASGSALKKVKAGGYGSFTEWPADRAAVDAELSKVDSSIVWNGAGTLPAWSKGAIYGAAWLKGMGIAYSVKNVQEFNSDIKKYVSNSSLRKPHWEVTSGEFLNAQS